ncbi:hypothetical protein F5Y19DRAFT_389809 [Xylariaceae sp. FL1651]|nr:hypothetical protein F5Y19DRAFT_389809 [Xylariaceae sp. FL1651]
MTDLGPLTAVFTPGPVPELCSSIHLGTNGGGTWLQQGRLNNCFPPNFQSLDGYYYSPGVCQAGYTYACTTSYSGSGTTAATCCPSGFSCHLGRDTADPNACISVLPSNSVVKIDVFSYSSLVTRSVGKLNTTIPQGNTVFAEGLAVLRASDDPEWTGGVIHPASITAESRPTVPAMATSTTTTELPPATSQPGGDSPSNATAGLTTAAKVGIGIGVTVGVAFLFGALAASYLIGRKRGRLNKHDGGTSRANKQVGSSTVSELDGEKSIVQLSADREPAELMSPYV